MKLTAAESTPPLADLRPPPSGPPERMARRRARPHDGERGGAAAEFR